MLKQRLAAFETIQPLFRAAEICADQAAAAAARCIAEMLRIREEAGLPIETGTEMLDKLVAALTHNVEARKQFIDAHALTPELLKSIGLEKAYGDASPCPPTLPAHGELTVVPKAAAA